MTVLYIVMAIYLFNAVLALLPAFCLVALGGKSEEMWKVPVFALGWPWYLWVLIRTNWKFITRYRSDE